MYRIICISDSDKHFSGACEEYEKRLGKSLDIINLKPIKYGTKEQIIQKETDKLLEKMIHEKNKERTIILLSKDGKHVSTKQFVQLCAPNKAFTCFIGGPYGLDEQRLAAHIDAKIAFGKQTMPHGLAKLVLIEQIYRASMIQENRSYHY